MVFAPRILAIALRLGTLVGCKRIVVTVGEKIGNTHLTDAQGTSADLVARLTIRAADIDGLPLSTPRRQAATGGPSSIFQSRYEPEAGVM